MPSAAMAVPSESARSREDSGGTSNEAGSLELLRSSEAFPLALAERLGSVESEGEAAGAEVPPFPLLPGEAVARWGRAASTARLFLTNYRLFAALPSPAATATTRLAFLDIPLVAIEALEMRELFTLLLALKDGKIARLTFANNEDCLSWYKVLTGVALGLEKREKVFAFAFRAWCLDEARNQLPGVEAEELIRETVTESTRTDFQRMALDPKFWRISSINKNFDLCTSYPEEWVLPADISDDEVRRGAGHRWLKRAPALVWRHPRTGAALLRSSQPAPGLFSWRNPEDEKLLTAFARAAAEGRPEAPPLLILDARSYTAAWANRAKGGGFESPEYYQKCEVEFRGLANIHAIRSSFSQLRTLLGMPAETEDAGTWLQSLQTTGWLQHLSLLLAAATRAAEAIEEEGRCVLVHCSDGWDRTPQILSLARVILDPEARTGPGFRALVQRDWIDYGHKFADRLGLLAAGSPSERSPVFLQFLDAVHQLLNQYPLAFQFNAAYLVKLAQHSCSGLFGTFLCNSPAEVAKEKVRERTFSVWAFLAGSQFQNPLYETRQGPLWPQTQVGQLSLWRLLYAPEDPTAPRPRSPLPAPTPLQRTHSCDSLSSDTSASLPTLLRSAAPATSLASPPPSTSTPTPSASALPTTPPDLPNGHADLSTDSVDAITPSAIATQTDTEPGQPLTNGGGPHEEAVQEIEAEVRVAMRGLLVAEEAAEDRRESLSEDPLWAEDSAPAHVSTSTSDISDSLVRRDSPPGRGRRRRARRGGELGLELDGLPRVREPLQERLRALAGQHQRRVARLEAQIARLRTQLSDHGPKCPNAHPNSLNNGERKESNSSWLEVEEELDESEEWGDGWEGLSDSGATKWIPDHAVSHCMGCDTAFWAMNRRHHCRSCGKVFCAKCSQSSCPVPQETLFQAVRVCKTCFAKLNKERSLPKTDTTPTSNTITSTN